MKRLLIFCLSISSLLSYSQNTTPKKEKRKIFIGIDLAQPLMQLISDKAGYEVIASFPIKKRWQIAGEFGYETNAYNETGWLSNSRGMFGRLGANWVIEQDEINPNMNFYVGGRFAYSHFTQKIDQYLIKGKGIPSIKGSLPQHTGNAFWIEPLVGASVPIRNSDFYINAMVGISLLIHSSNEYSINSLSIPGFGDNDNGINLRLIWTIGYAF